MRDGAHWQSGSFVDGLLVGGDMNRDPEAWARLGRAIRGERERYGWSRKQLSRAANISATAAQYAEQGRVPVSRWPQTIASIERSLGWSPGSAKAILEGETPEFPPFPLEIRLIEEALKRSVWLDVYDGDVAAAAGVRIEDWWRIVSRISPPVRASATVLAHIACALHITDRELTNVGRADAASELGALPFTYGDVAERIPRIREDDPRFLTLLALTSTFSKEEFREALRFLGFKIPVFDDPYLWEVITTLVDYESKRPE